jgi:hypothetical protein
MIKPRKISCVGRVTCMGEKRNAYEVLLWTEGQRSFGRLRQRQEDNINMDHKRIGWEGVDWINLSQDRALLNTWWTFRFHKTGNFFPSLATLVFSRRTLLHGLS